MQELRLHILISLRHSEFSDEFFWVQEKYGNIPQIGMWSKNNETWHYFCHGYGCRLINLESLEPIDWDAPDLNEFDVYSFLNHLKWLIQHRPGELPKLFQELPEEEGFLERIVLNTVDKLVREHLLDKSKTNPHRYKY